MSCPHCAATTTTERPRRTALGSRTSRCTHCRRLFNERTGTPYNHLQYPTDVVLLVVLWRRRAKRRGLGGTKWHADETYARVDGRWRSLYRAIDREGNLVEALLSEQRDMAAARRCFARALDIVGHAPAQVTTDGHDAYPRAIRETLGQRVRHRTSRDKNNRIEQDHRGVKQRHYPMRGFGAFAAAARFCVGFEEQRQYFRAHARSGERASLAARRHRFQERWAVVMPELAAA